VEALGREAFHLAQEKDPLSQFLGQKAGHLGSWGHPDLRGSLGQELGEEAPCGEDLYQDQGAAGRRKAKVNPAHPAMIP